MLAAIDWGEAREWLLVLGGVVAFAKGLYEYQKAQKWKQGEWIAGEMRYFLDDPKVQNALLMLDWADRRLPLLLTAPEASGPTAFDYEQAMLLHALSSRSKPQTQDYSDAELSIRDCFDRFFDGLERQESFIRAGLVEYRDVSPYLGYWLRVLYDHSNPRKPPAVRERLLAYIADYGFEGTQRLLDLACKEDSKASPT